MLNEQRLCLLAEECRLLGISKLAFRQMRQTVQNFAVVLYPRYDVLFICLRLPPLFRVVIWNHRSSLSLMTQIEREESANKPQQPASVRLVATKNWMTEWRLQWSVLNEGVNRQQRATSAALLLSMTRVSVLSTQTSSCFIRPHRSNGSRHERWVGVFIRRRAFWFASELAVRKLCAHPTTTVKTTQQQRRTKSPSQYVILHFNTRPFV